MANSKHYPSKMFSVSKLVKIPVYSSLRLKDGKLLGEIKGFMNTPIECIKQEKKVH
ncbi:hypothetical protein J14TS2_16640 [Bacillus sp. J14TS2]|nr:hypothetical protein J14TS2_16640 [Bacillus sp. J14TS2]